MEKALNIKGLFVNYNIAPVTRENHLQNFQNFLNGSQNWVWYVNGISGCGKTTLIYQIIDQILESDKIPYVYLSLESTPQIVDPVKMAEHIAKGLTANSENPVTDAVLEPIRNQLKNAYASLGTGIRKGLQSENLRRLANPGWRVSANLMRFAFSKAIESIQSEIKSRVSPEQKAVIIIDDFEQMAKHTGIEFQKWFWDTFLADISGCCPKLRVVLSSAQRPRFPVGFNFIEYNIGMFSGPETLEMFQNAGLPDREMASWVYKLTRGHPLFMNMLIDLVKQKAVEIEEIETAVNQDVKPGQWVCGLFFERLPESHQVVAKNVSLFRRFDLQMLNKVFAILESPVEESMLNEIIGTAVIGSDGDKYQTHEIIRKFIHNLSYQENREHAQSLYRAIQVYFYPEENATILLDQEDLLERFYYQFVFRGILLVETSFAATAEKVETRLCSPIASYRPAIFTGLR